MRFLTVALLSTVIPFFISLCLYRRKKCTVWTVVIAPLVGLFVFLLLIILLIVASGDM